MVDGDRCSYITSCFGEVDNLVRETVALARAAVGP